MTIADERILEFLSEEGPRQPKQIAHDERIIFSDQYVGQRCRTLAPYGLIQNLGNGLYAVTDAGQRYLDEKLDARDLEND
jgi:predicted transcriptional regulator